MFLLRLLLKRTFIRGGGSAYIHCISAVVQAMVLKVMKRLVLVSILKALEAPLRQISANARASQGAVIINNVKDSKDGFGFNALTEEYVNMFEAGIIDPTKGH